MEYVAALLFLFFAAIFVFCLAVMVKVWRRNLNINNTSATMDAEYEEMLRNINSGSRRTRNKFKLN